MFSSTELPVAPARVGANCRATIPLIAPAFRQRLILRMPVANLRENQPVVSERAGI